MQLGLRTHAVPVGEVEASLLSLVAWQNNLNTSGPEACRLSPAGIHRTAVVLTGLCRYLRDQGFGEIARSLPESYVGVISGEVWREDPAYREEPWRYSG